MLNCSQRILPKSTSHNKNSKRKTDYTIEVPYCSAVQNLVAWPLGFVHPCVQPILYSTAGVKQCAVPLAVSLCWLAHELQATRGNTKTSYQVSFRFARSHARASKPTPTCHVCLCQQLNEGLNVKKP